MSKIFHVNMLPARQGDCLWIEYGEGEHTHRVIIDGGTPGTYPRLLALLETLPVQRRQIDLLVVTHIDSDHIGGVLSLLSKAPGSLVVEDIWFNGWRHLPGSGFEEFGPVQGEKLTSQLDKDELPWNEAFERKAVVIPETGDLPEMVLPGGLKCTLLSPNTKELEKLRPVWEIECKKAGLVPGQPPVPSHPVPPGFEIMGPVNIDQLAQSAYSGDDSSANGSSIAFLAEYDDRRILFAGDAHAEVLQTGIQRLVPAGGRLRLDAFKIPHHGSKFNLSRELLSRLDCRRYLFSTDGTQFRHPDHQAVARVIRFGGDHPELVFNYRCAATTLWDNHGWKSRYGYCASYPEPGVDGLRVAI